MTLVQLSEEMGLLGQLMAAMTWMNDPSSIEDLEGAANAFGGWEKDGTVDLVKRIYEALYQGMKRPIEWIRDQFGQYWLPDLPPYIEEDQHIGRMATFFEDHAVEWALDNRTWQTFRWRIKEGRGGAPVAGEIISMDDWIGADVSADSDLTLHLITRARAAFGERDHRTSVITAMIAVEREAARFLNSQFAAQSIPIAGKALENLRRRAGIKLILESFVLAMGQAAAIENIDELVKNVIRANESRNGLVHGRLRDISRDAARTHLEACEALLRAILPDEIRLRNPSWVQWSS